MSKWLTREEVDFYLDNRKEKGFNLIQVCLFWGKRKDNPVRFTLNPPNAYVQSFQRLAIDFRHENQLIIPFIVLAVLFTGCSKDLKTEVTDLNVKFISNISLDPVFSWKISCKQPGYKQKAYQILISDNPEDIKRNHGNIWNVGRQDGDNQQVTFLNINQLQNGILYYSKVFVWNNLEKNRTGRYKE